MFVLPGLMLPGSEIAPQAYSQAQSCFPNPDNYLPGPLSRWLWRITQEALSERPLRPGSSATLHLVETLLPTPLPWPALNAGILGPSQCRSRSPSLHPHGLALPMVHSSLLQPALASSKSLGLGLRKPGFESLSPADLLCDFGRAIVLSELRFPSGDGLASLVSKLE